MKSNRQQGSGLFLVLIIATALGIGIYSTLDLVQGEFLRNKKAAAYHEAKQAAESILQASIADLKNRFENQSAFPVDSLSPSRNPLYISDEFVQIHSEEDSLSNLILPAITKYSAAAQFNTQATEVIGGQVPPGDWVYIDPRIPGNQFDELAGTRVFERNIEMISKATVNRAQVGEATVYARQYLQVRDAPLFAYAIFYNVPLEIAPGPRMDIYGNVHSNTDSWFQSGEQLNFHSKVTLAGQLYHGRHPDYGRSASYSPVRIADASGKLVNLKKDGTWPEDSAADFSGSWLTSSEDNFADLADQVFDGNLQTQDHGILSQNPVGVSDYIEDTNPSTDKKESFNSAYNLIQPVLKETELAVPSQTDDPAGYEAALKLNEVEQQKFAYKAGLVIEVETDGDIKYYTYNRNSDGSLKYNSSGTPRTRTLEPSTDFATYKNFAEEDGDVTSGLHDKRQAEDLDIIEIDISKLKDLVHTNDKNDWGGNADRQTPEKWWNGVVYVAFPQEETTSSRDDNVNPAIGGRAVKLINGDIIPNPEFAHATDTYGMTLATNQMLYVEGHYNADGDLNTGSPTTPDDPSTFGQEGHEAPAALIADSVTFLSESWTDADSIHELSDRRASNTEVSAAVLTGLVPSGETGSTSYSGGVENFPRFLENWNDITIQIRGSLVALFESEVGTRGWGYGNVYNAPRREWGFHSKFGEGYLPPGTPNTRRYRGIDFQLINEAEYSSHVSRLKSYF
ncbi:hypothetical protein QEH59_02925 [Coraliomargarita sp. SDUM461004]|uniref:Flp pilus-assembly TadG-like N-terminal domain-containing protein n=1 Tax=Thalassobacterium sedimentorum TaxID=3041258 RepID=A0ABU1AEZ1_9BACT|nr:hypothetical protein [Coraliomargarita sp. SDUM461004]MDQ8193361.1 hypothetical protein [Coraliomargarita sp. SDUM461004]